MKPEDLSYTESHEWVSFSKEGANEIATIGISAFAVEQLTDLVFMQLPKKGEKVIAGKSFGEVESVKAVSSLYSPVSGEVVDVNATLPDHLEKLGNDPYDAGWMIKVAVSDRNQSKLMDYKAYEAQCKSEGH